MSLEVVKKLFWISPSFQDESKLLDLESTIREREAKIQSLESELAESVAAKNMYKVQLQGYVLLCINKLYVYNDAYIS